VYLFESSENPTYKLKKLMQCPRIRNHSTPADVDFCCSATVLELVLAKRRVSLVEPSASCNPWHQHVRVWVRLSRESGLRVRLEWV
jgi:hypothetical protein